MTYESDLAAAKRTRRAWGCPCGADNPPAYDACHDCQRPSWACGSCGTVASAAWSRCPECDNTVPAEQLGDRAEGFEMSWEEFVGLQVGPRAVGGRYDHGDDDSAYEVLAIDRGPRTQWPSWQITVRYQHDGRETTHCTGWDPARDRTVAQPSITGPAALPPLPPGALVVAVGPAAAGKSTYAAAAPVDVVISLDALRHQLGGAGDQSVTPAAVATQNTLIEQHLAAGKTVFLDSTNVEPHVRAELVARARRHGRPTIAARFLPDLDTCRERNQHRPATRRVPDHVLAWQHDLTVTATERVLRAEGFTAAHQILGPADDPYATAPDLATEKTALVALSTTLTGEHRSAAALRELALRKAAYLDRAALTVPGDAIASALAATAAWELRCHDHAFGSGTGPVPPRDVTSVARARDYVRQEYARRDTSGI